MAKKTLQDRMSDMMPYFKGIEMYNEGLIVKVQYPQKWSAYNSVDGRIKVTASETTPNEFFYFASSQDSTYDDIFDLIEETIKANQDVILKVKLLRDKVEELRELFSKLSYDELQTLKFVTESVKSSKGGKKHTRKKKEALRPSDEAREALDESVVTSEEEVVETKEEN